jgi:hypothetical protein
MRIATSKDNDTTWLGGVRPDLAPDRTPEAKPRGPTVPVEIERKFLVTHDGWRRPEPGRRYRRVYLCGGEITARVRRAGSQGFLTIKGTSTGLGRPEVHRSGAHDTFILLRLRMACRSTSKMTAVDQPNSRTPFIAAIGPSRRQRSTGTTSP